MTNYNYLTTFYPHHEEELVSYLQHNRIKYSFVGGTQDSNTYKIKGKVDMRRLLSSLKRNGIFVSTNSNNILPVE